MYYSVGPSGPYPSWVAPSQEQARTAEMEGMLAQMAQMQARLNFLTQPEGTDLAAAVVGTQAARWGPRSHPAPPGGGETLQPELVNLTFGRLGTLEDQAARTGPGPPPPPLPPAGSETPPPVASIQGVSASPEKQGGRCAVSRRGPLLESVRGFRRP